MSTSLVLANRYLRDRFDVVHLDTSDHRVGGELGRWDPTNVSLALRHVWRLARLVRGGPGLVYLPLSQSVGGLTRDLLFIDVAVRARWHVATHLRGSEFRVVYERLALPMRTWVRRSLRKVCSMAVMGSRHRSIFEGLIPIDRVAVVPNGTPDVKRNGVPRDPRLVLFLSNLRPRKGLLQAFDAACLVLERRTDARFLFVGDWRDERLADELHRRASAYNGRIEFRAPAVDEEKAGLLASASILLFPPILPEGHPRVVLEGLSAGLPVVTTDRGAIAETVTDGVNGYVLPDPDPRRLADRLLELLNDNELRERMSHAARRAYLERFTQEEADRHLAAWLSELAADLSPTEHA